MNEKMKRISATVLALSMVAAHPSAALTAFAEDGEGETPNLSEAGGEGIPTVVDAGEVPAETPSDPQNEPAAAEVPEVTLTPAEPGPNDTPTGGNPTTNGTDPAPAENGNEGQDESNEPVISGSEGEGETGASGSGESVPTDPGNTEGGEEGNGGKTGEGGVSTTDPEPSADPASNNEGEGENTGEGEGAEDPEGAGGEEDKGEGKGENESNDPEADPEGTPAADPGVDPDTPVVDDATVEAVKSSIESGIFNKDESIDLSSLGISKDAWASSEALQSAFNDVVLSATGIDYLEGGYEITYGLDDEGNEIVLAIVPAYAEDPKEENQAPTLTFDELSEIVRDGFANHAASIDLSSHNLSEEYWAQNSFNGVYTSVTNSNPNLFYVKGWTLVKEVRDGVSYIVSIEPTYTESSEEDSARYEQAVSSAMGSVGSGMSDIQKVIALHDYLATNVTYDQSLQHASGYNALVDGTAVCDGYVQAFADLLNRAGIPNAVATSFNGQHAWNMVCINGSWYHVDVTWDDNDNSSFPYTYRNFMKSDAAMAQTHDSWSAPYTADSDLFDGMNTNSWTSIKNGSHSNHTYSAPSFTWSADKLTCTARFTCQIGGETTDAPCSVTSTVPSEQTCTTDGRVQYTASVTMNGADYSDTAFVVQPATGHAYSVSFDWSEDHSTCTARYSCTNCGDAGSGSCTVTSNVIEPTCTKGGKTTYTATFAMDGEIYKDTVDADYTLPTGHSFTSAPPFQWDEHHNCIAVFTCDHCEETDQLSCEVEQSQSTATCTTPGVVVYTATVLYDGQIYTDVKEEDVAQLGHSYAAPEFFWNEEGTSCIAKAVCERCASGVDIPCSISSVTNAATCEADGSIRRTASCTFNGQNYQNVRNDVLPALGHNYGVPTFHWNEDFTTCEAEFICANCQDVKTEACVVTGEFINGTCTEGGRTTMTATISLESQTYTDSKVIRTEPTGHVYDNAIFCWSEDHSTCYANISCIRGDDTKQVDCTVTTSTKAATCTEAGETTYTATCEYDGKTFSDTYSEETEEAHGHTYAAKSFAWNDDYSDCLLTIRCEHCQDEVQLDCSVSSDYTEGNCTTGGMTTYTASVSYAGALFTDTKVKHETPTGHSYGVPAFAWDTVNYTCNALFTCEKCSDIQTIGCHVTKQETPVSCTNDGEIKAFASCTFMDQSYSDIYSIKTGDALGHEYGTPQFIWSEDHSSCIAKFTCERGDDAKELACAVTSSFTEGNCTTGGKTTYTATVHFGDNDYSDTQDVILEAIGHEYDAPVFTWTDDNTCTAAVSCIRGDDTHAVDCTVSSVETPATCTQDGKIVYTATSVLNETTYTDTKTVATDPATGHSYGMPAFAWNEDYTACTVTFACEKGDDTQVLSAEITSSTTEPTCTVDGKTVYTARTLFLGVQYTDTKTVVLDKLEHSYNVPEFTWAEDHACSAKFVCERGDDAQDINCTVTSVTTDPTYAQEGKTVYTASVMFAGETYSDSMTAPIPKLEKTSLTGAFLTLAIPEGGYTYDGSSKEPVPTLTLNSESLDLSSFSISYSNNRNAGTATVKVATTDESPYDGSFSETFEIAKGDFSVKEANAGAAYGSSTSFNLASLALPENAVFGEISFSDADSIFSVAPSLTGTMLHYTLAAQAGNVGKSVVVQIPVSSDNYNDYTLTLTISVEKKPAVPSKPQHEQNLTLNDTSCTYGDEDFTLAVSGAASGSIVTFTSSNSSVATVSKDGKVHVLRPGTVYVTAAASATATHKAASATCTLTVAPKSVSVGSGTLQVEKTYDGTVSGGTLSGDLNISGILDSDKDTTVKLGAVPAFKSADAGTSTVEIPIQVSGSAADCYKLESALVTVPAVILARTVYPQVNVQTEGFVYTGKEVNPTLTVSAAPYALLQDKDYTVSFKNNVKAGYATAVISPVEGSNFTFAERNVSFEIGRCEYRFGGVQDQTVRIGSGIGAVQANAKAFGVGDESVSGSLSWFTDAAHSVPVTSIFTFQGSASEKVTLYWVFTPDSTETNYSAEPQSGSVNFTLLAKDVPGEGHDIPSDGPVNPGSSTESGGTTNSGSGAPTESNGAASEGTGNITVPTTDASAATGSHVTATEAPTPFTTPVESAASNEQTVQENGEGTVSEGDSNPAADTGAPSNDSTSAASDSNDAPSDVQAPEQKKPSPAAVAVGGASAVSLVGIGAYLARKRGWLKALAKALKK